VYVGGGNSLNGCTRKTVIKTSCVFVSINILSVNTLTTNRKINTVGSRFATVRFMTIHSSRTEHFRLVVHHCRNSSVFSLLSALLAPYWCASVSSFSVLVQFF
jgi:hypothetical protein